MRYRMHRRFTDFPVGEMFYIGDKLYRRKPNGIVVRCRPCCSGIIYEAYKRREKRRMGR